MAQREWWLSIFYRDTTGVSDRWGQIGSTKGWRETAAAIGRGWVYRCDVW